MESAGSIDYLKLQLVPEESMLCVTWLRGVSSGEYRQGLLHLRQLILDHGIKLWFVDARRLTHVTFEDQQWIIKEIIPELLASSLQKFVRVVQPDVFSYITFEDLLRRAQQNYSLIGHVEQFTSAEAAMAWLQMND
ncbi:hypothetical protein [Pontibacter chinhatensis]|uniref:SpoIIAA-like n=1 Tax=Pontibacter chinhatensis TaxID=1436961 RepID=A0A1I2NRD7_9BACT|nr:hypothetical protein [Pontibacter chinhatensis]SFG05570.1 hypothetical protein SAMN05421739_101804 [Pontibacter chinhatensis]